MVHVEAVRQLLERLQTQQTDQALLLEKLSYFGVDDFDPEILNILKGNNIFSVLAKVLTDNFDKWRSDFPPWIVQLANFTYEYATYDNAFLLDQSKELVAAYRTYLLNDCRDALESFSVFSSNLRKILLQENDIYDIIKKSRSQHAWNYFSHCAAGFDPWRLKILEDKEYLVSLATLQEPRVWNLLNSIAMHPDAKILIPNEVVVNAGKAGIFSATNLYALLCNDSDLASIALEASYVETLSNALNELLATGKAIVDGSPRLLLSLLRPIANISTADCYKDVFGEKMVTSLLKVVCDKLLDSRRIVANLPQSRATAAKTLWNLAYLKINCTRIHQANGIERLTTTKLTTDDAELKQNIEGILYMCNAALQEDNDTKRANEKTEGTPPSTNQPQASVHVGATRKGHVMISYNWDNQPIVKQIAQSLKDHGYSVWLDIEQMGGSTLEAMALAIEHSEMVLICMSQKCKDSPNCRLEGEYCVNKKVPFVPLMMQKGYSPDGWLGITLGAKLWYDFTNDSAWDVKMKGLVKAIGDNGKILKPNSVVEQHASPALKNDISKAKAWTAEDMLNWVRAEDIAQPEELYEILCKHKVNQKALGELKYLLNDPLMPAFAKFSHFQSMCKDMGIGEIGMALQLAAAIRKL